MRLLARAAAIACALPLIATSAATAALAEDGVAATNPNLFNLQAEGNGMFFEYRGSAAPATDNVSASPWAAFASVNSSSSSRAFAGLPYFGSFLQTLPATVNGLSGGATPPLPPLPGYVESSYPSKGEAKESQGPYVIKASSDEFSSSSSAASGFSPEADNPTQQIYSTASVKALGDGTVKSVATAGVQMLKMGPLKILRFGNKETLTESGDGKPVSTSETELGTFEVAGIRVGITQKGFEVGDGATALPAAAGLDAVNSALSGAGMEIGYIPRTVTKDALSGVTTVLSSALRVRMLQQVPALGPTTVTYVFGRVSVSSSDVKDQSAVGGLPVDVPSTPDVPALPEAPAGTVDAPVTADLPTGGLSSESGTGTAPEIGAPELPSLGTGSTAPATPSQLLGAVPTLNAAATSSDTSLLYLVLVLGGAAVLVGQQLFSRFGVRLLMRA